MSRITAALAVLTIGSLSMKASAELVAEFDLGTGSNTSQIMFQFTNQNQYLYTIRYEGDSTGQELVEFIAQEQPDYFIPVIESFSFGDALFGLSIGEDQDAGFGTEPPYLDYWHYWTKESENDVWENSMVGFGSRVLTDGSMDGWVFNSNDAPIPAPAVIPAILGLGIVRRRRG